MSSKLVKFHKVCLKSTLISCYKVDNLPYQWVIKHNLEKKIDFYRIEHFLGSRIFSHFNFKTNINQVAIIIIEI